MVRLPTYDNERPLEIGAGTFRTIDTREAERDLAQGFGAMASGLNAVADLQEKEKLRDDKFKADQMILDFQDIGRKTLESEAAENMPREGTGFHNATMEKLTKTANQVLARLPESQRQHGEAALQRSVFDMSNAALNAEKGQQKAFISNVTKQTLGRVEENVKVGAWDMKRAEQEIDGFLNGSGLSENQRTQMREVMMQTAGLARVERLRTQSPELFLRDTQKYLPNSPNASASDLQKTIAYQAQAYGEDPRYLLMVAGLESSFNPSATGKGTIKGLYQMTKGERVRLAAKLGVGEDDITKDPATASAAMAVLAKEQRQYLENNGIPATPMSMWTAHLLGKGGALHFFRADPNTDAYELYKKLSPDTADKAFADNGELLRKGMTVGQVLAAVNKKVDGGLQDVNRMLDADPKGDPKAPVEVMGEKFSGLVPGDIIAATTRAQADVVKRTNDRILDNARTATVTNPAIANPYDVTWRKEQDEIEKKEQHGQKILTGDQNVYAYYSNYAAQHGYLPTGVVAAARQMINQPGSPEAQLRGYDLLARVAKADPTNGLRLSKVGGDEDSIGNNDAAKVRNYINMTTHLGYGESPQSRLSAIAQIEKQAGEDWKVKDARVKSDIETRVKARTFSEISTSLDLYKWSIPFFQKGFDKRPTDPAIQNRMEQMYQERFRYWYTDTGSETIAKANAISELNRSVGYSRTNGTPMLTVHPVENYYPPAVAVSTRADGTQKAASELTDKEYSAAYGYINSQAKASVLSAKGTDPSGKPIDIIPAKLRSQIKDSDIQLVMTGNTKRDVEAGRPPRYNVDVRIGGGWRHVLQDWRPDPQLGRDNATDGERRAGNQFTTPTPSAAPSQDLQNKRDLLRGKLDAVRGK